VKTSSYLFLSALMIGAPAFAQRTAASAAVVAPPPAVVPSPVAAPAVAVAAASPDASGKYMLREGEDVNLQFSDDLSSKTASEGDPVALTLTDDLKVGNVVVAKAGSHAFGEVTKAEKSGMLGKAGELNLRLNYLKVGDTKIQLRGSRGKEGQSGTTGAVVLTVLFGPIGLIKHGKNVEIKKGQALHSYVADDVAVLPAS
jgi:hypothetical protein